MRCVTAALRLGLKVPDDLAIAGCYDTPWAKLSPVKLTSVSFDWRKLAAVAAELAVEDSPPRKVVHIKPTLVIRESTCGRNQQ